MKLYTKTVCPRCMWVKSEALRSGIELEIINIDQDENARERLVKAGMMSVPVLETNGQFIINTEEMIKILGGTNE